MRCKFSKCKNGQELRSIVNKNGHIKEDVNHRRVDEVGNFIICITSCRPMRYVIIYNYFEI